MSDDVAVVDLKGVKKDYLVKGRSVPVPALRGVTMEIPDGSMVAIKGPSGSGKTTLLQIIGALDVPTSGSAVVDGMELAEMSETQLTEYRAVTIGFVFQTFNLLPNLTALENVELPMEATDTPKDERRKRALALLKAVDMTDRVDYKPLKLSGGEQQRVAIARALANAPSMILADEPTGSLDSRTGKTIMRLLDRLREEHGTTVIVVTHSRQAAKMCDHTYTIKDGVITSEEDTDLLEDIDTRKKDMRKALSASGKIVNRLFDAGYDSIGAIANATVSEVSDVVGNRNKAEKLVRKAKILEELEQDVVD